MDDGGYSIMINGGDNDGKYIGKSADSNGMDIKDAAQKNTISYTSYGVEMTGTSGAVIRYNATSGQERFRYFKAATYTAQKEVALYKKVVGIAVPTPTVEVSATEALTGSSVTVSISIPSGAASVQYTLDGSDPKVGGTAITSNASFNVTSNATIKAVSVGSDGSFSAEVEKTVVFLPVLEGLSALKAAERGTHFVELENAIVTYVNGSNAFMEDAEVGALVYKYGHGLTAGECLNGVYKVVTTTFKGAFEITTFDSYSGDVTTAEIPCTTLTLAQLSANFAAYESKRVKIEDVTVTDAIATGDRDGEISDGTNTMVLRAGVDSVAATVNATITATGYPTIYNTTNQFTVWEQDDIEETLNVTVTSIAVSGYTANYNVGETFTFEGTVTATFSNGTTETVTPTSVSAPDMTTAGTKTVTVSYEYNGNTVTATYQIIVAAPVEKTYILYSGELTEGDYIIYYDGKAMNTTVSSNRLQYSEITPEDDVITTSKDSIVWHIAKSGDYWTICNVKSGKYAASTGTKNQAILISEITNNALWTSTEDAAEYEFVNKANAEDKINANLRNNGTFGFACYAASTGGALSLYKQGVVPTLTGITLSDYTTDYYVGETFSFDGKCTASFSDGTSRVVTPTAVSTPDMTEPGTKDVTVSYTFKNVEKTKTYQITVDAPVEKTYLLYSGELTEGDYIVYYNGKAMSAKVSSDRLQYGEVTPDDNDVITTSKDSIVWHIEKSGDYWTIYNARVKEYAAGTGTDNKAQLLADGTDDKALWTATEDAGYEFVNKANSAANVNANLRNNGTYGFACYGTATGGALSLYKQGEVSTLTGIALSGHTTSYFVNQAFSFDGVCTATFSDGSTKVVTPTSVSEPDMTTVGEKTVTISYTYREVTKTATYTITVNEREPLNFVDVVTGTGIYQKVTSATELEAGKRYLIVYNDGVSDDAYIFAGVDTMNIGSYVVGTVSDEKIDNSVVNATPIVLQAAGNNWYLMEGENFLTYNLPVGTKKYNNLFSVSDGYADGTIWTLDFESESGYLINNVYNTERYLNFNATSGQERFACYLSSSSQQDVVLYKEIVASAKTGDVNEDGEVNVTDVTALVSMILGNTPKNDAADVNGDGEVNVTDVTALVSIILGQ